MVRNGQIPWSVAEALGISENLIHKWKRSARTLSLAATARSWLQMCKAMSLRPPIEGHGPIRDFMVYETVTGEGD